jgi:uncharacterized membrane protein YdfJ with MMPL/SSD domain
MSLARRSIAIFRLWTALALEPSAGPLAGALAEAARGTAELPPVPPSSAEMGSGTLDAPAEASTGSEAAMQDRGINVPSHSAEPE